MLNIIQLGLGPIGQQLTCYLAERKGISIVGAVDPDPEKAGKDLGEVAGLGQIGIDILTTLDSLDNVDDADVAVISTLSSLEKVESQITEAADKGLDIVSTCEELSYPWKSQPEIASRVDEYCKAKEVSCLGTGVNPGFLMDYLPSVLSSVCQEVDHIKVERIQNAEPRRRPFRNKIGVGLTASEFEEKSSAIRHVGLSESMWMIAEAMNWELNEVSEKLAPVMVKETLKTERVKVQKGQVAGVQQVARGYVEEEEVITLVFKAAVGIQEPYDAVTITGNPDFRSTISGGINGDIATAAIVVNAIHAICQAAPGLKTMLDIQAPACFSKI